jgi:polyphosphate glucokinase
MADQPTDDPEVPVPGVHLEGLALGIDVGGTGVKAALVNLATAELVGLRARERTPQPSHPDAVIQTIASVVAQAIGGTDVPPDLPAGCGLPGVVKYHRLTTAANIDPAWVGWPAEEKISEAIGHPTLIINDADAAGLAEMGFGAGRGQGGTVLMLTLGTGIGSALFIDGVLVPNTEFGHLEFRGKDAEVRLSGASRERRRLGWKAWAREFDEYLSRLELYFGPDLFIFGGGVSKEWERWGKYLTRSTPIRTAQYLNVSGIIGAAYAAGAARQARLQAPRVRRESEPESEPEVPSTLVGVAG